MREKIFIGIDPAFRENGIGAAIIRDSEIVAPKLANFSSFCSWVLELKRNSENIDYYFSVENSNLQKGNFHFAKTKAIAYSIGLDVGKNQAVSQMIVDFLVCIFSRDFVFEFSPLQKGEKLDKVEIDLLCHANKITPLKRENQDVRDAIKLAVMLKNRLG